MNGAPFGDGDVTAIAEEIRRYVRAHPRSKDSTAGIRNWWLAPAASSVPTATVQEAIDRLVREGVLVTETLPGGGVIYGSARREPPED